MKSLNPFLITGYYKPRYFCDRKTETEKIIDTLKNGRNITLVAHRRIGKTTLIKHIFYKLRKNNDFILIHLEILSTSNIKGFINQLGRSVLGNSGSSPELLLEKARNLFPDLSTTLQIDHITGLHNLQFNFDTENEGMSAIEQIFDFLNKQKKKVVVAIDDFQQILSYPEKKIEEILWTNIQKSQNLNFIFTGSHEHLISSIFYNEGRPFYQNADFVHLEEITQKTYKKFIRNQFKKSTKKLDESVLNYILDFTRRRTYYVQYICNKIYSSKKNKIDENYVKDVACDYLLEMEPLYYNIRNLLSEYQWKLLSAIAHEGEAKKITSGEFITKYGLNAPSSVKTAIKALLEKEMIFREEDYYQVYDVMFEKWLARN